MKWNTVGVPKEVKQEEGRVGITPRGVTELVLMGATVLVEEGAGVLAGISDESYKRAGAVIATKEEVWKQSSLVVKVKEPQRDEYDLLEHLRGGTLFTYLHLAGVDPELTTRLLSAEVTSIAYENVSVPGSGGYPTYPLLAPMSKIAGREAMFGGLKAYDPQARRYLHAVIIGCGVVGESALRFARSVDVRNVVIFEDRPERARELSETYRSHGVSVHSLSELSDKSGQSKLRDANIVVCAPMVPGGKEAPLVLTRKLLSLLPSRAYLADVSIDQGGSTYATRGRPTAPGKIRIYGKNAIRVSAVSNIPGSTVPREATNALAGATLPYVLKLFKGHRDAQAGGVYCAMRDYAPLQGGLQTYKGHLYNRAVAECHGLHAHYRSPGLLFE